jgi:hypothetical protein
MTSHYGLVHHLQPSTLFPEAVTFDTDNPTLGTRPIEIAIKWSKYGNPKGNLQMGIRESSYDLY